MKTSEYFRQRAKTIGRGDGGVSELVAQAASRCQTEGCHRWYQVVEGYTSTSVVDGRTTFHCSEECAG